MALKFTTTDRAAAVSGVKTLAYSRAGIGKTTLCATCPAPIILSAEAGLLALAKFQIPVIEIKTVDDLTEAHSWLLSSTEARQFATICIDSVSEIGEVVLSNAKLQVKDPRQAYGELIEKMLMVIKKFRDIQGKHVYVTAKEEREVDQYTGRVLRVPSMPGRQLGPGLPYYFDEVFHLGVGTTAEGKTYRYLRTQPDFQYEAKDRSGKLDPIEPPDLNHIITKILKGD
jgi:hypothetical protein